MGNIGWSVAICSWDGTEVIAGAVVRICWCCSIPDKCSAKVAPGGNCGHLSWAVLHFGSNHPLFECFQSFQRESLLICLVLLFSISVWQFQKQQTKVPPIPWVNESTCQHKCSSNCRELVFDILDQKQRHRFSMLFVCQSWIRFPGSSSRTLNLLVSRFVKLFGWKICSIEKND